jgi:hypothetical protein
LLLIPFVGLCGDKHKPLKIPVSRWKEIKRMTFDSTVQEFTDTLYVQFKRKDSFSYHNKDGFIYNGGYTIDEDSVIDFGTAKYKIVMKRPATLIFADDKLLHVLRFDLSDTVRVDVIAKEDSVLPVKDIELMIGHWTVFKKETEKQAESIDFGSEIKAVYITGPSSDGKQGYVYGGLDGNNHPTWYVKGLGNDQTLECAGKSARAIKILKCQKGEMILEDDGIKYFLKQFK